MADIAAPKLGSPDERVLGTPTNLSVNRACEAWRVPADSTLEPFREDAAIQVWKEHATLRRIGWIDQKGRVWTGVPSMLGFDGGSLTPLLIDAREG